jgi:hypothetical protein
MDIQNRLKSLAQLRKFISLQTDELMNKVQYAGLKNQWFTQEYVMDALDAIATHYLNEKLLSDWVQPYAFNGDTVSKRVGIIAAGNIPLVSFHDILSVLVSGHQAVIKLSEKDNVLIPFLLKELIKMDARWESKISFEDRWHQIDAVIATGSTNTGRYFEYYFGKYPNIIRKNRHSAAVLMGNESSEELSALATDVFHYYGLGCRNVSMVWLPENYPILTLVDAWKSFERLMMHHAYKNNMDYQRTLLLMNNEPLVDCDFLNIVQSQQLASPISTLHIAHYKEDAEIQNWISSHEHQIQCMVNYPFNGVVMPFGQAQQPSLTDYADGIDTLSFLANL